MNTTLIVSIIVIYFIIGLVLSAVEHSRKDYSLTYWPDDLMQVEVFVFFFWILYYTKFFGIILLWKFIAEKTDEILTRMYSK